jgi:hypothetical protein
MENFALKSADLERETCSDVAYFFIQMMKDVQIKFPVMRT